MDGVLDSQALAPGIHRVETVTDDKLHGYHVLEGTAGPILLDPGYAGAPTEVYRPFLEERGQSLSDVTMALITHADADHHGAMRELREHAPGATIAAHEADARLIEHVDRIMDERYGMFEADHDLAYGDEVIDWLTDMLGPEEPLDLRLRGGERVGLGDRTLTALHTPGHTRGHLMFYDPEHDVLLGGDGFFGRGLTDVDGDYLQPPPYHCYPEYETSIQLVEALDPDVLSFTHYEVMRGDEIDAFVEESLAFVSEIETLALEIVDERGPVTLREAIDAVVDRRGSFGLDLDLAFPLSAHYDAFVDRGVLERTERDGLVAWRRA